MTTTTKFFARVMLALTAMLSLAGLVLMLFGLGMLPARAAELIGRVLGWVVIATIPTMLVVGLIQGFKTLTGGD